MYVHVRACAHTHTHTHTHDYSQRNQTLLSQAVVSKVEEEACQGVLKMICEDDVRRKY